MTLLKQKSLAEFDTYVYIDVSNIRMCCLKTLEWELDFSKLMNYLKTKYPHLREVRYYEGLMSGDVKKRHELEQLEKLGFLVCSLERKAYFAPASYKEVSCKKCKNKQKVQVSGRKSKLKSNVDVYLAAQLLKRSYLTKRRVHIILLSCDGDYAEMIREAIETNKKVHISVLATPVIKGGNNTCSVKLQDMRGKLPRYHLTDIRDIEDYIKK